MNNENTCISCGEQIPEGRTICPKCETIGIQPIRQIRRIEIQPEIHDFYQDIRDLQAKNEEQDTEIKYLKARYYAIYTFTVVLGTLLSIITAYLAFKIK